MIRSRATAGFTFVELLVVIVILVVLSGVIITGYVSKIGEANQAVAVQKITALETSLNVFKIAAKRYPTTAEGLQALVEPPEELEGKWKDPLKQKDITDPWDREFQYECPGTHNREGFDIWSLGADGVEGGEGENADICNWE